MFLGPGFSPLGCPGMTKIGAAISLRPKESSNDASLAFQRDGLSPGLAAARRHATGSTIPSRLFDPKIGADLYHRYLDEWALCDELGINIMTNEHHATATCADSVCTIPMAILARETKKVRLLALGMPIGNRNDPIRVAEEYSMIDVISRGRLEMGFVKGVPFEISPANTNPADLMERFWEAHDLILKAMTTHDGPFNWEGTHFQYRSVNVWPRP